MIHIEGSGLHGPAELHVPITDEEITLTKLKTELERSGGCRQWINDVAIERLSSKITELFERHNLRLAQAFEEMTSAGFDSATSGDKDEWSALARFTNLLAEFAADVCAQFDRGLRTMVGHLSALRLSIGRTYEVTEEMVNKSVTKSSHLRDINNFTEFDHRSDAERISNSEAEAAELAANTANIQWRLADASAIAARVSARVAAAEERATALEHDARRAAGDASRASERALVTARAAAEEADRSKEEERRRLEEFEEREQQLREDAVRLEEETRRARKQEEWKRRCDTFMRKRSSTFDILSLERLVYRVEPGITGIDIGCIVSVLRHQLVHDNVEVMKVCQADVDRSLLAANEQLVSDVVRIRTSVDVTDLDPWPAVAIPYVQVQKLTPYREYVVKMSLSDVDRWTILPSKEASFTEIDEAKVGQFFEVPLRCSEVVYLAVVTRPLREQLTVSRRHTEAFSSLDPRLAFMFDTLKSRFEFGVEVLPIDSLTLQELRQRDETTFSKLVSCSPIIRITLGRHVDTDHTIADAAETTGGTMSSPPIFQLDTSGPGPVKLHVPIPPAPTRSKGHNGGRPSTSAGGRPLAASNANSAAGRHSSLGIRESGNGRGGGPVATRGMRRPKTAHLITYRGSVFGDSSSNEDNSTVHVLTSKKDGGKWTLLPLTTPPGVIKHDVVSFQLDNLFNGRIIVLRKSPAGLLANLDVVASKLESAVRRSRVCALLRQRHDQSERVEDQSSHVVLHLIHRSKIDRLLKTLEDEGYEVGPPPSADMELSEGQMLMVKLRGNITSTDETEFRLVFNSNIRTRLDFRVSVIDRYAQHSIDTYRGFLQICISPTAAAAVPGVAADSHEGDGGLMPLTTFDSPPLSTSGVSVAINSIKTHEGSSAVGARHVRTLSRGSTLTNDSALSKSDAPLCELIVCIPKVNENPTKPIIIRTPVVIHGTGNPRQVTSCLPVVIHGTEGPVDGSLLRHLAVKIGDQWRRLVVELGVPRLRIESILRNSLDTDEDADIIHHMLTSWINRLPRAADKASILRAALMKCGRSDLADVIKVKEEFIRRDLFEKAQHGSSLRRALVTAARHAYLVSDLSDFCRRLGLSDQEIDTIRYRYEGVREMCYQSLLLWTQFYAGNNDPSVSMLLEKLRSVECNQLADLVETDYRRSR